MNKLIINVGISGSGKSTWTTNYIKEHPNILRINRDDIRKTLVGDLEGYYQRKDLKTIENSITFIEDYLFGTISDDKYDVILDNTHLKQSYINRWIDKINSYYKGDKEYNIQFKLFDISLEEAKERVCMREFDEPICDTWDSNKEQLKYIDKQYKDYQDIKQYILLTYLDQII